MAGRGPEGKGPGRGGMPDLLKRIGAPLVVAFLLLLTIISMVIDRRPEKEAGVALPWWQAVVLEVTAPIERVVSAPIDGLKGVFSIFDRRIHTKYFVQLRDLEYRSDIWIVQPRQGYASTTFTGSLVQGQQFSKRFRG